jgi:hypothetical protein
MLTDLIHSIIINFASKSMYVVFLKLAFVNLPELESVYLLLSIIYRFHELNFSTNSTYL